MSALVIGGAGFIGANVALRHVERGERVVVFDNLSRRGALANLQWLEGLGSDLVRVVPGDAARQPRKLTAEIAVATRIYHLAGQVAVTTSIADPMADHESNMVSTLNVLEGMRATGSEAPLIFSSTNKVYGGLEELGTTITNDRWDYADARAGIDESMGIDFHSPYGCSKGGADQYVRDYARVYGLNTTVMRQSCIYGPRQFGVEAQGWIVHFILATAMGRPLTVFGDGRQVRDALYVTDLVDAFEAVAERSAEVRGDVFNVGGGRVNSLSIRELLAHLERIFGHPIAVDYGPWRQGDQKVFISDNGKLERELGWRSKVSLVDGLERTVAFVRTNLDLFRGVLS